MEFSFSRPTFKKAIDICQSITDSKQNAKIWIKSFTDTDILIYTSRDKKGLKYFHQLKTTVPLDSDISFSANPYEFIELLKGRDKVRTLYIDEDNKSITYDDKSVSIELIEGNFPIKKMPYINLIDEQSFIELLVNLVNASSNQVTNIELGGYEASIKNELYIKRFNLLEDFKKFVFPLDYIKLLKSNILWPKKTLNKIAQCYTENNLYLRINNTSEDSPELSIRQLFVLSSQGDSPSAKQYNEKVINRFSINKQELMDALSLYKNEVKDVYLYKDKERLIIDTYGLNFRREIENYSHTEDLQPSSLLTIDGEINDLKCNKNALKSLIIGHREDELEFEEIIYTDPLEIVDDFTSLRLKNNFVYSVLATKKEPNYSKLQKELDNLLSYEKTLTFLNE